MRAISESLQAPGLSMVRIAFREKESGGAPPAALLEAKMTSGSWQNRYPRLPHVHYRSTKSQQVTPNLPRATS